MAKTRILFFAGKGGVGKTTHASATALACARRGHSTLLISTDPAHSLSDLLQVPRASHQSKILPCLDILEIDPYHELQCNWGNIRDYLSTLMTTLGAEETVASELAIIPGMDNLFSLLRLQEFFETGQYDVIVVDMAPTGDSLRLLSLPQMISTALKITRYLEKYLISPVVRPASRVSKSLQRVVAPADVARSWEQILEKLIAVREIIDQRTVASVRLVMTPEKLVISESQRTLTYLSLFGLTTDLVIVNRLYPPDPSPMIRSWVECQQNNLRLIQVTFAPIRVRTAEQTREEMSGIASLESFSESLYGSEDPSELYYNQPPVRIVAGKKSKLFSVAMPFIDPVQCQLMTRSNELMINYGSQLRSYILPDSFIGLVPGEASYKNGYLEIPFHKSAS